MKFTQKIRKSLGTTIFNTGLGCAGYVERLPERLKRGEYRAVVSSQLKLLRNNLVRACGISLAMRHNEVTDFGKLGRMKECVKCSEKFMCLTRGGYLACIVKDDDCADKVFWEIEKDGDRFRFQSAYTGTNSPCPLCRILGDEGSIPPLEGWLLQELEKKEGCFGTHDCASHIDFRNFAVLLDLIQDRDAILTLYDLSMLAPWYRRVVDKEEEDIPSFYYHLGCMEEMVSSDFLFTLANVKVGQLNTVTEALTVQDRYDPPVQAAKYIFGDKYPCIYGAWYSRERVFGKIMRKVDMTHHSFVVRGFRES